MSSSFGTLFRATTFGESHGRGVGVVVDGCPAGLTLRAQDVQRQLDRRRPGASDLGTPRNETDRVEILSGVQDDRTLGSPIAMLVRNRDAQPADYDALERAPRPSHADYTYACKYGLRVRSGGGRASARETLARVAAGAVAEALLGPAGVRIVAWVSAVGTENAPEPAVRTLSRAQVDAHPVRCPDLPCAERMAAGIRAARDASDSLGGIVTCACLGVPAGWGEPVFGKLEACLAMAMLSIPAAHGFEIGSGFAGARMRGAEHNDRFVGRDHGLGTATNHSGGIQGGISNGEPIVFRVAFKPVATLGRPQTTAAWDGTETVLAAGGRHDPCVVPRAVPVVEGMAALTLADACLLQARMARGGPRAQE